MQRIAIFGAGGLGRSFLQLVKALASVGTPIECVGFLVDEEFATVASVHGVPVFKGFGQLNRVVNVRFAEAFQRARQPPEARA